MDLKKSPAKDSLFRRLQALRGGGGRLRLATFSPRSVTSAIRMLLDLYPVRYRNDAALQEATLRAFVITVIPGANRDDPDLVRMYHDRDYPFYPYSPYLVFDLSKRTRRRSPSGTFADLPADQRTSILCEALSSDETTSRLFKGAILMAQVSHYAGIYSPQRGCALIDFPGRNSGFTLQEISRPDAETYLGVAATSDGNPV